MSRKRRLFCPYCSSAITKKMEGDNLRDYCAGCRSFFYENPLPVVSSILDSERKILLVKRGRAPFKGMWCLPTGFAETGETIEEAVLRELEEETGIRGRINRLLDVDSLENRFYGDLLFLTFVVDPIGGQPMAGDDSDAVRFFPVDKIPRLAFRPNTKAVAAYIRTKRDYWAIVDAIATENDKESERKPAPNLLSRRLVEIIEKNAEIIAWSWTDDVKTSKSTPGYHHLDQRELSKTALTVLSQISLWLGGAYTDLNIHDYYIALGVDGRARGFPLSEILSMISLTRKHIWDFALARGVWQQTIDLYMTFELERRLVIFFDRAAYYTTRGYEGSDR